MATASADKEVRVWDVAGGFCTHAFSGHSGVVLRVLFHPRQLLLVTAGDDGLVLVWDLVNKSLAATLKARPCLPSTLACCVASCCDCQSGLHVTVPDTRIVLSPIDL